MPVSSDYLHYVLEQLAGLASVSARRMFGAVGLYCDELFFALVDNDVVYLRVNDDNRADYTARGMSQFRPYADRPQLSVKYYETPADVLEDAGVLVAWAQRAVAAARAAPAKAGKTPSRRAPTARRGGRTRA